MNKINTGLLGSPDQQFIDLLVRFPEVQLSVWDIPYSHGYIPGTIDLLFIVMDNQIRENGLGPLLQALGRPRWVMVSDLAKDGILAFDHGAMDLLLPPFSTDRMEKCLARIRRSIPIGQANTEGPKAKPLNWLEGT